MGKSFIIMCLAICWLSSEKVRTVSVHTSSKILARDSRKQFEKLYAHYGHRLKCAHELKVGKKMNTDKHLLLIDEGDHYLFQ
jgi:hypothetical protein